MSKNCKSLVFCANFFYTITRTHQLHYAVFSVRSALRESDQTFLKTYLYNFLNTLSSNLLATQHNSILD